MDQPRLTPGSIVVGVDGSEHADRALDWAAGQASLERRPLTVLHCADELVLRNTGWLDVQGIDHVQLQVALRRAAQSVVHTAVARARERAPAVAVTGVLSYDDPRQALVDAGRAAHLVVVGSRGRGPLKSTLLGSVSVSVARQAGCPVVVCRPSRASEAGDGIVVGADGTAGSLSVTEFAFVQASLRRVPLTVVHCFWDATTDVVAEGDELHAVLSQAVAGLREKYPDVRVDLQLTRGLVDECLADAEPVAELLVVGRPNASTWDRFVHASCGLAVLERARTTVAVVPETPEEQNLS